MKAHLFVGASGLQAGWGRDPLRSGEDRPEGRTLAVAGCHALRSHPACQGGLASEEQRAVLASEEAAVATECEASELASGARG